MSFLSVNNYCFLYKNFYSFYFLILGFLVAFYMARKNLGFCKQIEQWEGLYYIKKMFETLIFIKERMPFDNRHGMPNIIGISIIFPS